MATKDSFNSARLLIADARDDIYRLNMMVREWLDSNPDCRTIERDTETGWYTYTVKFCQPLPERIPLLVRRATGSLRSALDHAVHASSVSLGCKPLSSTKFPFADSERDLEGDIKRGCKGVHASIITILKMLQPHEGGNKLLWSLNKLRNVKDHRTLVPNLLAGGISFPAEIAGEKKLGLLIAPAQHWDPMENQLVFQTPRKEDMQDDIKTIFFITFGDVADLEGKHVVPILYEMARIVEGCVRAIEMGTERLLTPGNSGEDTSNHT